MPSTPAALQADTDNVCPRSIQVCCAGAGVKEGGQENGPQKVTFREALKVLSFQDNTGSLLQVNYFLLNTAQAHVGLTQSNTKDTAAWAP